MTETKRRPARSRRVEMAVLNSLATALNDMDLHPPTEDLAKMAAWVTRRALLSHAKEVAREGPAMELRAQLHRLWEAAGEPSTRQMGRDLGMSHMTWHNALRCEPVPSWSVFSRLVTYLDGDPGRLEELWLLAKGRGTTP